MAAKHPAQPWPALPYPILLTHSITHSAGKGLWDHPGVDILHMGGCTTLGQDFCSLQLPETQFLAVTPCYNVYHNHPYHKILSGIK